jgi:hypothetical protein
MKRSQKAFVVYCKIRAELRVADVNALQRPYWVILDVTRATGMARNVRYDRTAHGKGLWHNLLSCLNGQLNVLRVWVALNDSIHCSISCAAAGGGFAAL